ncbi:transposon Tf2-9 polyprotein [Trichonephila clavipes]|nr:transposon Tf2-9 polyprotein [Trichonephila clavipes]
MNPHCTNVSRGKLPPRTTQPNSRVRTLTSTFAGLKEDTNEETYVTPPHSQISEAQNVLQQIVIEMRSHHPQTNGRNERVNQSLVTRLKCKLLGGKRNMTETSDISKTQTSENQLNLPNQLIDFDPNNSLQGQVEKLLQAGLIEQSNSPYSASVTLDFKRDDDKNTRICIDFRKLNAVCKADSKPLPIMVSLLDKLARAIFFSTLDLASGYWHVPIHHKDTEKLAFCTKFGLYE